MLQPAPLLFSARFSMPKAFSTSRFAFDSQISFYFLSRATAADFLSPNGLMLQGR